MIVLKYVFWILFHCILLLFLKYKQKLTEIWNAKIFFAGTNFREYDLYKDFAGI